jgi:hypothetical protein
MEPPGGKQWGGGQFPVTKELGLKPRPMPPARLRLAGRLCALLSLGGLPTAGEKPGRQINLLNSSSNNLGASSLRGVSRITLFIYV